MNTTIEKRSRLEYGLMMITVGWILYTSLEVISSLVDGDYFMMAISLFAVGVIAGFLVLIKGIMKDGYMESEATSLTFGEEEEVYMHSDGKRHRRVKRNIPPNYSLKFGYITITIFIVLLEATMSMFTSTSYSNTLLDKRVTNSLEYGALDASAKSGKQANEDFLQAQTNFISMQNTHDAKCDREWSVKFKTRRQECYNKFNIQAPTQSEIKVNTSVDPKDVKELKQEKSNIIMDYGLVLLYLFFLSLMMIATHILEERRLKAFKDKIKISAVSNEPDAYKESMKEIVQSNLNTDSQIVALKTKSENDYKLVLAKLEAQKLEEKAQRLSEGKEVTIGDTVSSVLHASKQKISGLSTAKKYSVYSKKNDEDFFNDLKFELKENPEKSFSSSQEPKIDIFEPKNFYHGSGEFEEQKNETISTKDENQELANLIIETINNYGEAVKVGDLLYRKVPTNDFLADKIGIAKSTITKRITALEEGGYILFGRGGVGNQKYRYLMV